MGTAVTVTNNIGVITGAVIPELARQGLDLGAERLLALSSTEVPLDLGTLLGTGQVVSAVTLEEGAAVVYDTPYAARLHEHPEYQFQNGRKGKYLEDPALENRDEIGQVIAKGAGVA